MTTTTLFANFYLDVTEDYAEEQMIDALLRDGILTFDAIQSTRELLYLCNKLGTIVNHRDANEVGLTQIVKWSNIQPINSYQAFTASHLTLHTDGSSIPNPAHLIVLWCAQPAEEGGISLLADGKHIYQILAKEYPNVLQALTTPNSAIFLGQIAPLYSSVFSVLENGNIYLRFRYDDLGYYSASVIAILPTFLEILKRSTISLTLKKGQGYIIQNGRWLHGRTAFQGEREMYRALVNPDEGTPMGKRVQFGFNSDP